MHDGQLIFDPVLALAELERKDPKAGALIESRWNSSETKGRRR